jgi:tRNA A-37 threonylcarbamoyl transferase component Bud32
MLANLMPPPIEVVNVRVRAAEVVASPSSSASPTPNAASASFVAHPRYRSWLAKCGITSAESALNLQGEIVSGHPDRHVMRVQLRAGTSTRTAYLKREHHVGWRVRMRNWRAKFGWVSRSAREAGILQRLEDANLPCPHWLAYGEDAQGRAFVLIDELSGSRDLRIVLAQSKSPSERRAIIAKLATTVAEYHAAGLTTPDLSAKHVFVRTGNFAITLIDWQSSGGAATQDSHVRALATLHASLAPHLANTRERLRFLRQYLRDQRFSTTESLKTFAHHIATLSDQLASRSSIRLQRQTSPSAEQRLVWLADEAVCAVPDVAVSWPKPAICEPYYRDPSALVTDGERLRIRLEDGRPAMLLRFRSTNRIAQLWSQLRGKSWRSRAAEHAQLMWQLDRHGVAVAPLYAFGQRAPIEGVADSFLVYGLPNGSLTLAAWLQQASLDRADRRGMYRELGRVVRQVHDAGATLGANRDAIRVVLHGPREHLLIDSVADVRRVREWSDSVRLSDLMIVLRSLDQTLTRSDLLRVFRGYSVDPEQRRRWMRTMRTVPTRATTQARGA